MDILEPLLVSAQAIAQERELVLDLVEIGDVNSVFVDAKALREVLNNLLDNALKYTSAGGTVKVIIGINGNNNHHDGRQRQGLAIADTGPGIPPEDLPHLFERHFRGAQAEGDIPGTGLGLAIAQLLMQQMQGNIEVFSPSATFSALVPNLTEVAAPSRTTPLMHQQAISPNVTSPPAQFPGTVFVVWMPQVNSLYSGRHIG